MNKSRMIYFSINANQMFLQQSPLAKPSIQKGIMNEQFWYAIVFFESIHVKKKKENHKKTQTKTGLVCWFTLNQYELLVKGLKDLSSV